MTFINTTEFFFKKLAVNKKISLKRFSSSLKGGVLTGTRVLDLTRVLAGPYATMVLGDLGAEIIKIEKIGSGDDTRSWGPPFVNGESSYFLSVNRNKKSLAVDLKSKEGVSIIKEMIKSSDVLIENFVPGSLKKIGLSYDDMKQTDPHLIYCSITGYGSSGPYHKRPGYDVIAASVGGLMAATGPENGEPCKVGVAMTDLATGLYAHGAILAALIERNKTGLGQLIECDLLSTQISCLVNLASAFLNGGQDVKRWGTAHVSIVPYQSFKTKDGYLTIGAGNDNQFKSLCERLDMNELADDMKFKTNLLRVMNRNELTETLNQCFQQKNTKEWLEKFEGSAFPFGSINTLKEVFSDPQVIHNKSVEEINHPIAGPIKQVSPAVRYSGMTNTIKTPPPTLGEHSREVLKNVLNYSDEKINDLIKRNIVQG